MDTELRNLLFERLATSPLAEEARREISDVVETRDCAPDCDDQPQPTGEVYLKAIEVQGFRGIGPVARLELAAQPGLTVVVGRNGSGKSSFASGLELLTTGDTKRWADRSKGWTETWQCLHHDGPTRIAVELMVAGEQVPIRLEQTWQRGAAYTAPDDAARVTDVLAESGWAEALERFRPFLAYAELASMFDKLTSLHEALAPILGLGEVDDVHKELAATRLTLEKQVKDLKATAHALIDELECDDARQARLAELLRASRPDHRGVRVHLDAYPPGAGIADEAARDLQARAAVPVPDEATIRDAHADLERARESLTELATKDAARALETAELFERALNLRTGDDCPVCRTTGVLDDTWASSAADEVAALRARAAELSHAKRQLAIATAAWKAAVVQLDGIDASSGVDSALHAALELRGDVADAREQLAELDGAWRRIRDRASGWLADAEAAASLPSRIKLLKSAEAWLRTEADGICNDRFAPIAQQAIANWEVLRHESNIELRKIEFKTSGRNKQASFDVRADGEDANAIGVMSQGELLALSLSVFLPRAGLDESPFRFAVIDDPVQSMDPAKVDGLARVLSQAATTRQIVVFTHDDRLPEAVRLLKLPARVLQVNRRSRSRVGIVESLSPIRRHLDDAKHMALSEQVPSAVSRRVVPTLCRSAVEAACADLLRGRAVRDGKPADHADQALEAAHTLRAQLALVLLEDPSTHDGLNDRLKQISNDGPAIVGALNAGSHGDYDGALLPLHRRTTHFIHDLMEGA